MADRIDMKLEKLELSSAGCKAILNGGPVLGMLDEQGEKVRGRASSMYNASAYGKTTRAGASRGHSFVYTADKHAMASNRVHNTLSKAVG